MFKKKKFFINLILVLVFPVFSESLNILSFNILGAKYDHIKENEIWMNNLSEIIRNSKSDIVLLQEVPQKYDEEINYTSFADELVNLLGDDWGFRSSAAYSNCSYNLNNAVLYKYSSVLILREIDNSSYDFKYKNVQMVEFSFRKDTNKKFYVVNVHLPFDRKKMDSPTNEMKLELDAIKNLIYDRRFPAIFGGDFNMSRRELITETQFSNTSRYTIDGNGSIYNDNQGLLTTVSTSSDTGIHLANGYDHFIVNNNLRIKKDMRRVFYELQSNTRSCKSIKIGNKTYKTRNSYIKNVSDHIPILITVDYKDEN